MAEKKNFTIENYNGIDYDTLYPETNSGQVLLDKTAQTSTGLESGKTLDDALQIVGKLNDYDNRFEVGDVLTTSRDNLSNKWALCNGDEMLSENYPKLANQFQAGLLNYKKNTQDLSTKLYSCRLACRKRNGVKECLFTTSSDSSSWSGRYSVIGSDANWISLDMTNRNYVFARNNIFFRCGGISIQWCADDPTNASSWHEMLLPDNTRTYTTDIFYKNGKYYMLMDDTFLIYDSLDAMPQAINIETVTGHKLSSDYVGLDGDNFLFWTHVGTNTYWVDTFNPSGSLVGSNQISEEFKGVIYSFSNGYIKMYTTDVLANQIIFNIEKVATVTGTGTIIAQVTFPESTIMINFQHDFIVNNSYVVLPNNTYIDSEFNLHNATSSTGDVLRAICSSDDMVCVASKSSSSIGTTNTAVWDSPTASSFFLPVYSPADGLRAYIKAKD